jgi:thiosulfate/3-mercaptopyruvate sulfurtransferase
MFNTLIDCQTLAQHLNEFVVIDSRHDLMQPMWGREAFAAGHLPGAQFASIDDDLSGAKTGHNGRHPLPPVERLAAQLGAWGIDQHTQVVVYDQGNAMMVGRLWWLLNYLGHDKVAVLDGGFAAWQAAGLPLSTATESKPSKTFVPQLRSEMRRTVAQVQNQLGSAQQVILDARAPQRYSGEVEPIDPRAGHIPGALNRPFNLNLASSGYFKSPAELQADFAQVLAATPIANLVHQCGSGVSACANILAMRHAGYPMTALYAGSWSEWSQDASRPVTLGATP